MSYPEYREAFTPLAWAAPFLNDPKWYIHPRRRTTTRAPGDSFDLFCADTIRNPDGMQLWAELYERPVQGSTNVDRALSLCKFGGGLAGFPTICHGGAAMTMMDDALGFLALANKVEEAGIDADDFGLLNQTIWKEALKNGKSLKDAAQEVYVTAHLDLKFLQPVPCPGMVGIECTVVERKDRGHKIRMVGVMKDAKGTPLIRAESLWIRLGGAVKL